MGTSISQPSPRTPNWSAVALGYRNEAVPEERVVRDLWRAAQSDPSADWSSLLASPIVATCMEIAIRSTNPAEALREATREIVRSGQASLAADVAKRAIARSFASDDREQAFRRAVFGETTSYLVSRDLPGHVGTDGRNHTVAEGLAFKERLRERVEASVGQVAASGRGQEAWVTFVSNAVQRLAGSTA